MHRRTTNGVSVGIRRIVGPTCTIRLEDQSMERLIRLDFEGGWRIGRSIDIPR